MAGLITIQGQVMNVVSNTPLARVKVIARQEGTEIQQETDKVGKYVLHLVPGLWRISVWARGFNEPDAYMYNFTADTVGIDFGLQEGYSISGLVVTQQDGKPAPGVIVEATSVIAGKSVFKQELSSAEGKYRFSGFQAGQWQVQGSRGESQTNKEKLTIGPDAFNLNLMLGREMTPKDWCSGRTFFGVLVSLLVILILVYLCEHKRVTPHLEPELTAFKGDVDQAIEIATKVINAGEGSSTSLQTLRSTVAALKENWGSVSKTIISISEGQNEQATLLLSRAETAVITDNIQDLELALATLKSVLANQPSIYFWSEPPWNYLEVIYWSLAGILVSLMITSGYYLRRKRFYAEGIWMHVSHLISVPLLALVVVFLISQIKLTIQIDESQVALDVRDPRLLAAISFTIAVRPWAMIEFVREAGSRFFSQIQSRIAGSRETQTPKKYNE